MFRFIGLVLTACMLTCAPLWAASDLEQAIRADDIVGVEAALAAGADPLEIAETGAPMIVVAAPRGVPEIVTLLLEAGADPNAATASGSTALMWAAYGNNPAIANVLVEAGADVDARDPQGDPAINWAAFYGAADYARALLEAHPDTSLRGHGNAFEIAVRRGGEEFVQLLADYDGRRLSEDHPGTDDIGRPLLHNAARIGDTEALHRLLSEGADVNAPDLIGFTALMHAARERQGASVQALLDAGADPRHISRDTGLRLTPLHLAAIGGDVGVVQMLVDAGADLDVQGTAGGTALRWAMYEGQQAAALALVEAGADPDLTSEGASTPRDLAAQLEWADVTAAINAR